MCDENIDDVKYRYICEDRMIDGCNFDDLSSSSLVCPPLILHEPAWCHALVLCSSYTVPSILSFVCLAHSHAVTSSMCLAWTPFILNEPH